MAKKKSRQKSKQRRREKTEEVQYAKGPVNEIVMESTPLFLKYVIIAGSMLNYLIILMGIMFAFVMGSMAVYILFGDGWKALWDFIVDFFTFWELKYVIGLCVIILPFLCWWYFSKYMMKHYKTDQFIVRTDGVILEKRDGVKLEISYPMLREYICSKKIQIGPDWIAMPYGDGKIRLYAMNKNDVRDLFQKLEERCDLSFPREELLMILNEYMIGWTVSYLFGIPLIIFGCYITVIGWMTEESWSLRGLVSYLLSTHNFLGVAGVIIILVGTVLKLIYFDSTRKEFEPYKDFFHVSL